MAKTSNSKSFLTRIDEKFSTSPGGRIFQLTDGLRINVKNDALAWRDDVTGAPFALTPGSTIANLLVNDLSYQPVNIVNLKGQASLAVPAASILSYAHEFTISFWVKDAPTSLTDVNPISSSFIMSSGSYGATFCGVSLQDRVTHHVTGSVPGVGSPSAFGAIAGSTNYNIGDTWFEQSLRTGIPSIYSFRKGQSSLAGGPNVGYPQWDPTSWRMITIVNKPARNKFETTDGVRTQTSKTGEEGRLETWVNGILVGQSPPIEGLPRGHALLFEEDYVNAIQNPSGSYSWLNGVGYGVIAQSDCRIILRGEPALGTKYYQISLWDKGLSATEIKALHDATVFGAYSKFETSWSVTPKSALYSDQRPPLTNRTSMLGDNPVGEIIPFADKTTGKSSVIDSSYYNSEFGDIIEGNFALDSELSLGNFEKWRTRDSFQGQVSSFNDEADESEAIYDPEFDVPAGSSIVKISIPNVGGPNVGAYAGRYFNHITANKTQDSFQEQAVADSGIPLLPGDSNGCRGSGFLYYSPTRKSWIEKRYDSSTSKYRDPQSAYTYYQANNVIHKSPVSTYGFGTQGATSTGGQDGFNSIMAQFSWSPQMGYYLPFEEFRNQIGYQKLGWPTSLFNAPNAPRYHGFDEETIKMKDYISSPFLVKKIVLDIPIKAFRRFRNWDEFPTISGIDYSNPPSLANVTADYVKYATNKKDIDNYTFFLYRQSRTSKVKDSIEDRTTSKRFIIASASLCFYNSPTFGKADDDSCPVNDDTTNLYGGRISNSATVDLNGNRITFSTQPTHEPAFSHDWNIGRNESTEMKLEKRVRIEMLPAVCPAQFVSPSLVPFSASFNSFAALSAANQDAYEAQTGSFLSPTATHGSLYTQLVSNFWFGGTTNPSYWNTWSDDTAGLFGTEAQPLVRPDVVANAGPTLNFFLSILQQDDPVGISGTTYTTGALNITNWRYTGTPPKAHYWGASNLISTSRRDKLIRPVSERYQIPIDPRSVNVPTVAPGNSSVPFDILDIALSIFGGDYTRVYEYYGALYSALNVSPFQYSPKASQVYSPYLLLPDDELIIGLDAGTFGPPDQATNSLSSTIITSSLKEAYRFAMADSWMQILSGDAEIKLIGEYLRDGSAIFSSKASNSTNGITNPVGMYQITDEFRARTLSELSGTLFDRVMVGSPGIVGIANSSRKIGSNLSSRRNLGTAASANYFFKIVDTSRNWFDETVFGYNNSDSNWSGSVGRARSIESTAERNGNDSFIFSPNHFGYFSDLYGSSPNRIYIKGDEIQTDAASPPVRTLYVSPSGSNLTLSPGSRYDGPLDVSSTDFFSVKYSSGSWAGQAKNRQATITTRYIDRQNEDGKVVD